MDQDTDWRASRLMILSKLEAIEKHLDDTNTRLDAMYTEEHNNYLSLKVEIVRLKVRSSVWGAISGAVPGFIAAFVMYLNK